MDNQYVVSRSDITKPIKCTIDGHVLHTHTHTHSMVTIMITLNSYISMHNINFNCVYISKLSDLQKNGEEAHFHFQ